MPASISNIIAICVLVLCVVFGALKLLAFWPALLIGLLACAELFD